MLCTLGSSNFSNSIGCVLQRLMYMVHQQSSTLGLDGERRRLPTARRVRSANVYLSEKGKVGWNLAFVALKFFSKPRSEERFLGPDANLCANQKQDKRRHE